MLEDKIQRFSVTERWAHWVHVASFFVLLCTGLAVLSPQLSFLAMPFGGMQTARVIHRAAGIIFAFLSLGVLLFGDRRALRRWLGDITMWDKDDAAFLKIFPREFFGGHPVLPEQGRFNSGEKVNSLLTLTGGTVLTVTGFIMWFAHNMPAGLVQWCYPLHDAAALALTAAVIGHMYLSFVHPGSKEALSGMLNGMVSRAFARSHHAKWYREVSPGDGGHEAR